jgi:carboxyl-terminal processing protease
MLHKGKLIVFLGSALIALYGISAAFYGKVVATDDAYPALSVFMDALNKINDDYVEAPEMSKVQEGAMRGLIDALDPYSGFLTKEEVQQLKQKKQSGDAGIGVVLSKRGDIIYVVSVLPESTAQSAGLRPGDYLLSVDGTGLEDKNLIEAHAMLEGAAGTLVKLSVFRNSKTEPVEIEVTRSASPPVSVAQRMLDGKIGLLDVSSLRSPAVEEARTKLKTLISAGAEKVILDLRDCADGEAADGAELANLFLKDGVIFQSKDRQGKVVQQVDAAPEKYVTGLPLAVLVNGSTAGPAEITAGALKDRERARIVGEKTFGSGSSQKRIALKNGAVLVLSTAKYVTPGGKMIQEENIRSTGIKPDVECPTSDRRQDLAVESYYEDKDESIKYNELRSKIAKEQLEKALEILGSSADSGG